MFTKFITYSRSSLKDCELELWTKNFVEKGLFKKKLTQSMKSFHENLNDNQKDETLKKMLLISEIEI